MVQKLRQIETRLGSNTPLLESLRKELEGMNQTQSVLAHHVSARSRVQSIRNSHVAQCGHIFFRKNRYGLLEFNPDAGRKLMLKIYGTEDGLYIPYRKN